MKTLTERERGSIGLPKQCPRPLNPEELLGTEPDYCKKLGCLGLGTSFHSNSPFKRKDLGPKGAWKEEVIGGSIKLAPGLILLSINSGQGLGQKREFHHRLGAIGIPKREGR